MTAEKFDATVESVFMGLFRDAQNNEVYDFVSVLWNAYTAWVSREPDGAAQRLFVSAIHLDAGLRACIKEKNSGALVAFLIDAQGDDSQCGGGPAVSCALESILAALGNEKMFKADTERKTWKRIQKLVYACDLQKIVSGQAVQEDPGVSGRSKVQKRAEEKSHIVQARITRFNTAYRQFLETLSVAFPEENGSPSTSCIEKFDELVAESDTIVLDAFKEKVLPMVPEIAKTVQSHEGADAHAKVFYEYFGRDSRWFCHLPLIDLLPVDLYWNSQMYVGEAREPLFKEYRNVPKPCRDEWFKGLSAGLPAFVPTESTPTEPAWRAGIAELRKKYADIDIGGWKEDFDRVDTNQMTIMKALADLACCMSGLDTLIYSPIIGVLKDKAQNYTEQNKITPDQLLPNSENFDRGVAMGLVMSLLDTIPEATGGKITKADMETLIQNTMTGNPEYPESFNEVFSPDMLDMDCLESVTELPGIGDALGPIMSSMQGQMTGVTGARPAFGSVATPAWLERD